jgi:hypothetical protein
VIFRSGFFVSEGKKKQLTKRKLPFRINNELGKTNKSEKQLTERNER